VPGIRSISLTLTAAALLAALSSCRQRGACPACAECRGLLQQAERQTADELKGIAPAANGKAAQALDETEAARMREALSRAAGGVERRRSQVDACLKTVERKLRQAGGSQPAQTEIAGLGEGANLYAEKSRRSIEAIYKRYNLGTPRYPKKGFEEF